MDQVYKIKEINDINNEFIKYVIFEWKIKNIVTYMDEIKYVSDDLITFKVEINKRCYFFAVKYLNNIWVIEFNNNIKQNCRTHIKILNMIEIINKKYNENIMPNEKHKHLIRFFDIIEKIIDEFKFDDVTSEEDSDNYTQIISQHNNHQSNIKNIDNIDNSDSESDENNNHHSHDSHDSHNSHHNHHRHHRHHRHNSSHSNDSHQKTDSDDSSDSLSIENIKFNSDDDPFVDDNQNSSKELIDLDKFETEIPNKLTEQNMDAMMESINMYNNVNPFHDNEDDEIIEKENKQNNNKIINKSNESNETNEIQSDPEDDFENFAEKISDGTFKTTNIDYSLLKINAINTINKLKVNEHQYKLFNPETAISLIINELKSISRSDGITLDMNETNIYDFKIMYKSNIFAKDIILRIILNPMEYPNSPPIINIIKPIFDINLNYNINVMDCLKLKNWNPINQLPFIITETIKLIEKYGKININKNSYSELNNNLIQLSIISGFVTGFTDIPDFQIVYNKHMSDMTNTNTENIWKSGTGYGSNESKKWDIKKYLESNKCKLNNLNVIVSNIIKNINDAIANSEINPYLLDDIQNSCLVEFVVLNLTDNLDISYVDTNEMFINNIINLCEIIFNFNSTLFKKYYDKFKETYNSINIINKFAPTNILLNKLKDTITKIYIWLESNHKIESEIKISNINEQRELVGASNTNIIQEYTTIMRPLQYGSCNKMDNVCKSGKKIINVLHLIRELNTLSKSLPLNYESSIFVKIDEDNLQNIHALVIPSHGTPYSCGCFLFHIYIPETYPKVPPIVKLITTGHGTVRFNPNLYVDGKVCLSLLGTWHGQASESWNESSTILQLLISIQSLIFIDEPYFNEPGYEHNINTELGKKNSENYNRQITYNTVCWAMIDMLQSPPKEFEDIIKIHFRLKKAHIMKEVHGWLEKSTSKSNSLFNKKYDELCELLNKL